jgi:ankyrin repeat protein
LVLLLHLVITPKAMDVGDDVGNEIDLILRDLIIDNDEEEEEQEDDSPRARLSALIGVRRPVDEIKALLDEHPELIREVSRDRCRRLPLHEAIIMGSSLEVIRYLLELWPSSARERVEGTAAEEEDAPQRRRDNNEGLSSEKGMYPLHLALTSSCCAARPYYFSLVKLLVEAFPLALEIRAPRCLRSPLHLALEAEYFPSIQVVRYLFEAYPDAFDRNLAVTGSHALHRKLQRAFKTNIADHMEVVEFLIEHDPTAIFEKDFHGRLPLHYAACDNVPVAVTAGLLEKHPGAVRERDDNFLGGGLVPLQVGVAHGTTVEHLQLLGAAWPESVSAKDDGAEGYTPLHRAIDRRDIQWDVIRYLAKTSPQSLTCRSAKGLLPLHVAVSSPSLFRNGTGPLWLAQYVFELCPDAVRERDDLRGELALHRAVRLDAPVPLLQFLVEKFPASVRETDAEGRLPLHLAVARTESALVASRLFLDEYPEAARTRDAYGRLPLHAAAATTRPNTVLLQRLTQIHPGAVRERDNEGYLPIHHAATSNRLAGTVSILVREWPESVQELTTGWGGTLLACAAAGGNASPDSVEFLAHLQPEAAGIRDSDGWLPLHHAVSHRHAELDVVRVFVGLAPEAVQDRANELGMLPLHCAAEEGAPLAVLQFLVEQRPESLADRCGGSGGLALHYAVTRSIPMPRVVQFLVEQRPESVRESFPDGMPVLHRAAGGGCTAVEIVRLLVEHHPASVRDADAEGKLPLHHAAAVPDRNPDVVGYLLEQFPQAARVRDGDGNLPVHLAALHAVGLDAIYMLVSSFPECACSSGQRTQRST